MALAEDTRRRLLLSSGAWQRGIAWAIRQAVFPASFDPCSLKRFYGS
jgi:hypothetical protein